ncbi:MAG: potassium transporter Kup [Candidatus Methylopumilus sp.]|nr:potassium transporter Kup [Candidatus Methylopumilus sp.]
MEDKKNNRKASLATLSLAALGVVFGDIGTSPLYTMKEVFSLSKHPVELTQFNVLGILSLIFWSLIMIVSAKYVAFIMRADNRGEGGIMALLSLANKNTVSSNKRTWIMILGILGACMFYADGMITPAISVLSAIEGLEVVAPSLNYLIIPITLIVLFILFWAQSRGTSVVGSLFGPVMFFWFLTLAVLGILNIIHQPHVLIAVNPIHAFNFFKLAPMVAFVALGAVVLSVTGAEALYADMGHFGRRPIRLAWFVFVLPALTLNYFGQGALIISNPENIKNPFYLMAPEFLVIPLIVLATLATIIASQAVITGAFSVSRQALQLGFLPRMHVEHTSENQEGQIYLPRINWLLMIAVMVLVITFKSSGNLAGAYGIAVTGDMVISTLLASFVFYEVWKWNSTKTIIFMFIFLMIDFAFFSANILKIPDGGWFPILIGLIIFLLMTTWKKGRALLYKILKGEAIEINSFIKSIGANPPPRVEGIAIFMTPNSDGVPHALLHNLKHNKVIHEKVIILTVMFMDYPHSLTKDLLTVEKLPYDFYKVIVKYGFKDEPDLPKDLALCAKNGLNIDPMNSSYFIGKEILLATPRDNMNYWRKKLFIGLFRSAETITNQFKLPPNRVVELGSQILF